MLQPDSMKLTKQARLWLMGGLVLASEGLYLALLRLNAINGLRPVLSFLGLLAALFVLYALAFRLARTPGDSSRGMLLLIAAGAVLFRLTLLPAGLPHDAGFRELCSDIRADLRGERVSFERFQLFDDDIWRYLWDGHVWAHGGNPYAFAPANAAVDAFADEDRPELSDQRAIWSDIRGNIPNPDVNTIYPPLGQVVFRLAHFIAPGSVLALKSVLVLFDLLGGLFLALALAAAGRPVTWVLLYVWNPLVVKVFAASGHSDAIAVAAVAALAYCLLRRAKVAAGLSFALAVLAKLIPIVLLPFVARRIGWRNSLFALMIILAAYVPFLGAGRSLFAGTSTYAHFWRFNSGPFELLNWLASGLGTQASRDVRLLMLFIFASVLAWLTWRDSGAVESFAPHAAAALGILIVLSPAVMPWYITVVIPLAILSGQRIWIWFSAIVCCAFFIMVDQREHAWALCLEYGLFAAPLCYHYYSAYRSKTRSRQPEAPFVAALGTGARSFPSRE